MSDTRAHGRSCNSPLLTDLPDECLVLIFGLLSIPERCRSVPPVCRRWRTLCASPELVRTVSIEAKLSYCVYSGTVPLRQQMHSLFLWLHTHVAPHVQRLSLNLLAPYRRADWDDDSLDDEPGKLADEEAVMAELPQALVGLLGAACAAGQLRELSLEIPHVQVHLGPWLLPAAGTLRSLSLNQEYTLLEVPVAAGLHRLTKLQELALCVDEGNILFRPGCRLPSQSLTQLYLTVVNPAEFQPLPSQVSTLSALRALWLNGIFTTCSSDALTGLPSLRCLRMCNCWALPGCLSQLTSLRELTVSQNWELSGLQLTAAAQEAVDDSLPFLSVGVAELRRLTSLLLRVSDHLSISTLPANLGHDLPLLRRFAWSGKREDEGALPIGMTSLRSAALPSPVAQRSLAQLAAARRLELLALNDSGLYSLHGQPVPGEGRQQQHALAVQAPQQLPSLRRLELTLSRADFQNAAAAVHGLAPALVVEPFDSWQWCTA
ncbi:hypothetical protein ABPG75_007054 [Micractinium tetrahymenae]